MGRGDYYVVVGSLNIDVLITADRPPRKGETVLGTGFGLFPGGKGANQAVAAARLGGEVSFICKTGNDIFGQQAIEGFKDEGINIEHIVSDKENPSGIALINVDKKGENSIVVAPGANNTLSKEDIKLARKKVGKIDIILLQLEIPLETVEYVAHLGFALGKKVILNPAPAQRLPDKLLKSV